MWVLRVGPRGGEGRGREGGASVAQPSCGVQPPTIASFSPGQQPLGLSPGVHLQRPLGALPLSLQAIRQIPPRQTAGGRADAPPRRACACASCHAYLRRCTPVLLLLRPTQNTLSVEIKEMDAVVDDYIGHANVPLVNVRQRGTDRVNVSVPAPAAQGPGLGGKARAGGDGSVAARRRRSWGGRGSGRTGEGRRDKRSAPVSQGAAVQYGARRQAAVFGSAPPVAEAC